MKTLHVKKYNAMQTAKWKKDYQKAILDGKLPSEMPQLVFYLFQKKYGYVAFGGHMALWAKSKKAVIAWWEDRMIKKS